MITLDAFSSEEKRNSTMIGNYKEFPPTTRRNHDASFPLRPSSSLHLIFSQAGWVTKTTFTLLHFVVRLVATLLSRDEVLIVITIIFLGRLLSSSLSEVDLLSTSAAAAVDDVGGVDLSELVFLVLCRLG